MTYFNIFCMTLLMLQFKADEIKGIITDFDEPGHLAPTGLFLGGAKYMVIQGEPGAVIRGKKVSSLQSIPFLTRLYYMHDMSKAFVKNFSICQSLIIRVVKILVLAYPHCLDHP